MLLDLMTVSCPVCHASTTKPVQHAAWHEEQELKLKETQREAQRYKMPPRYGGI